MNEVRFRRRAVSEVVPYACIHRHIGVWCEQGGIALEVNSASRDIHFGIQGKLAAHHLFGAAALRKDARGAALAEGDSARFAVEKWRGIRLAIRTHSIVVRGKINAPV